MDLLYKLSNDSNTQVLVQSALDFFTAQATNSELFNHIVQECLNNPLTKNDDSRQNRLKLGWLSHADFMYYATQNDNLLNCKARVTAGILIPLTNRLCQSLVIRRFSDEVAGIGPSGSGTTEFQVNEKLAQMYTLMGILDNIVYGPVYSIKKYSKAVFKIITTNKKGELGIGTGLLNIAVKDGERFNIIITNKHVVENKIDIEIESEEGISLAHEKVIYCEAHDLAAILLKDRSQFSIPTPHFYPDVDLLDEIVTIGYPPVPTTDRAYQLAHRGEITAFVKSYLHETDYLIFSSRTAPGNSGGPLINRIGFNDWISNCYGI